MNVLKELNEFFLAFLSMRQRQDTILVMLGYHARSRTREERRVQDRTHSFSWNLL